MQRIAYRYAVVPPADPAVTEMYLEEAEGHIERVLFDGEEAWLVERPARRRVERHWSIAHYGEPTFEDASDLLALSATRLSVVEPTLNWRMAYWREELAELRGVVARWWHRLCPDEVELCFLPPDGGWMGEPVLSPDELRIVTTDPDENVPVLMLARSVAVIRLLTKEWEGKPVRIIHATARQSKGAQMGLAHLCGKMWRFLPETIEAPAMPLDTPRYAEIMAWAGSTAWPEPRKIKRREEAVTDQRKHPWLEPFRSKQALRQAERQALLTR